MTPEGRIKKKIDELLKSYGDELHYDKPVVTPMGKRMLDYHICFRGKYVAIEAKRPSKEPTPLQAATRRSIERAGGVVFRINDDASLDEFNLWLDRNADIS